MNPSASRRAVVRATPWLAGAGLLGGCTGADPSRPAPGPNPTALPSPTHGPLGARPAGRPNVIIISVDDLSWRGLGCYGNTFVETPNIDAMAAEGVTFDQAYCAAAVCSPSRAALVTGLYPGRTGVTDYLRPENAPSNLFLDPALGGVGPTLARRGYEVALVGKWHLTETYSGPERERPGNPYDHGFTEVRASEERYIGPGDYTGPYDFMPNLPAEEGEYLTDRLTREAIEVITRDRHKPFYLYLANYAVHNTLAAPPDLVAHFEGKEGSDHPANNPVYAAMLTAVDDQVGRIRQALEEHGLAEKTLVLVTSDNGAQSRDLNAPLRGGKGVLLEGGIRAPLVAWSPGFVRAGYREQALTNTIDLLPTVADLAGTDTTLPVDGVSIVPLLTGRGVMEPRDTMFWAFPHYIGHTVPHAVVRKGNLKLLMELRSRSATLFDIARDPDEQHDLAASRPNQTRQLVRELDAHLAELHLFPDAPDLKARAQWRQDFVSRSPRWRQESSTDAGFESSTEGWLLTSSGPASALAVSPRAPKESRFVLDVAPVPGPGELTIGLVKDEENSLLVTVDQERRSIRWAVVTEGEDRTNQVEPLHRLDGHVDLSHARGRLALSMEGATGSVWNRRSGGRWQFLFRFDVGGVMDLGDPAVRSQYTFAVGARLPDGGSIGVKSLRATWTDEPVPSRLPGAPSGRPQSGTGRKPRGRRKMPATKG